MVSGAFRIRVGRRIAAERSASQISQRAVADALNITVGTVSRWENGEIFPEYANIVALAALFEISEERLLCGCDPEP